MKYTNAENAELFCKAIKRLAENPAALENLQSYLTAHFPEWMKKWASTPGDIATELNEFSKIAD